MNDVTNIEKIARTLEIDRAGTDGMQQIVEYEPGVGVSYGADRLLGGAFGLGVSNNVRHAYRFLALNYQPGDDIFIFGFSRGAYTARAVAGALNSVGLITRQALIGGRLREAIERYTHPHVDPPDLHGARPPVLADLSTFRDQCCHPADVATVTFLGVFDTVGALGVPGMFVPMEREFSNTRLGACVQIARQALAIDERRRVFEPCLWQIKDAEAHGDRIKQVWFEGVHSDIGGGYEECGLSTTTLRWMTDEAKTAGLVFDENLLNGYLEAPSPARRHDSMNTLYDIDNRRAKLRERLQRWRVGDGDRQVFLADGSRNLQPPVPTTDSGGGGSYCIPVRVASTVRANYQAGYQPFNVQSFMATAAPGRDFEETVRLPHDAEVPTLPHKKPRTHR